MINPNRIHRAKAIVAITNGRKTIQVKTRPVECFEDLSSFMVGEIVNIQASFSIALDRYVIRTVRKIKNRKTA